MRRYSLEKVEKNKTILEWIIRFIKIAIGIIIIPILLVNLVLVAKLIINRNQVPDIFGYKFFIVASESMEPKLKSGDLIVVNKNREINEGDIITYKKEKFITHKVLQIIYEDNTVKYMTKGDNNLGPDTSLVNVNEVEGVYVFSFYNGAKVLLYLQNPFVLIAIFMFIFAIYINSKMIEKRKRNRAKKREVYEKKN